MPLALMLPGLQGFGSLVLPPIVNIASTVNRTVTLNNTGGDPEDVDWGDGTIDASLIHTYDPGEVGYNIVASNGGGSSSVYAFIPAGFANLSSWFNRGKNNFSDLDGLFPVSMNGEIVRRTNSCSGSSYLTASSGFGTLVTNALNGMTAVQHNATVTLGWTLNDFSIASGQDFTIAFILKCEGRGAANPGGSSALMEIGLAKFYGWLGCSFFTNHGSFDSISADDQAIIIIRSKPSGVELWENGVLRGTGTALTASTINSNLGVFGFPNNGNWPFVGLDAHMVSWDQAVSDPELTKLNTTLLILQPAYIPDFSKPTVAIIGDSIAAAAAVTRNANGWFDLSVANLIGYDRINLAVSGSRTVDWDTGGIFANRLAPYWSAAYPEFIVIIAVGTNDTIAGEAAAVTYPKLISIGNNAKAMGSNVRVIFSTIINRAAFTAPMLVQKAALLALQQADFPVDSGIANITFADSGTVHGDELMNMGALDVPTSGDGTHPPDVDNIPMAALSSQAIAISLPSGTVIYTSPDTPPDSASWIFTGTAVVTDVGNTVTVDDPLLVTGIDTNSNNTVNGTFDFSEMVNLGIFDLDGAQSTDLNISGVASLTSLTVQACPFLEIVNASSTSITSFTADNCPSLTSFNVASTPDLTTVVLNNTAVTDVILTSTTVNTIVLSGTPVENLLLDCSSLTSLTFDKTGLVAVSINNSNLTDPLDFDAVSGMASFSANNNSSLTGITLTNLSALTGSVSISDNSAMTTLAANSSGMSELLVNGASSLTDFQFASCPNLANLEVQFSTSLSEVTFTTLPALTDIDFTNSAITTASGANGLSSLVNANFTNCSNLMVLNLTTVSSLNITGCSALTDLNLNGCISLSDFSGVANKFSLVTLDFNSCPFNQATVDQILLDLVSNGASNGTIDLQVAGGVQPSGSGLSNKAILESSGWAVLIN